MKKNQLISFVCVMFICFLTTLAQADSADNYFYFRLESGKKVANAEEFGGTYAVFENNSIPGLSLGSKVVTGNNGFNKLQPYVFKHLAYGWQLGAKYSEDSFQNQIFGPALRFKNKVWKLFIILDYTREFDFEGSDKNDKNDIWLYANTTNQDFNVGAEVWYYKFIGGSEYIQIRPLRLSYQYKANFFLMPNFCYKDGELMSRSLMTGVEIKF